jgi:glycosyltransferase involved in cell wall biosynthesis
MRILFLAPRLDYGGAERQLILLASGLARNGHRVTVAVMKSGPLDKVLEGAGVALICLDKRGPCDVVGYFWRWRRLLREIEPDIVHGYLPSANISCALSRIFDHRSRVVFGIRSSEIDSWSYGVRSGIHEVMEKFLSRFAHATIFNSKAGQEWTRRRRYHLGQTIVIANGIDVERFHRDEAARTRLRAALGIDSVAPVIAMLARFDPMKDHGTFLAAAQLFKSNAHFLLAGTGIETSNEQLRAMIERYGLSDRVHLLGARPDPENIWPAADLCCLSSRYGEGWPNALGEAMACGVPCVATDIGECAEILGDLGIVVPCGDAVRLSGGWHEMLRRCANDPLLPEKLRARVEAEFSLERLIDRTERFLSDLFVQSGGNIVRNGVEDRP